MTLQRELTTLQQDTSSPRAIALTRQRWLQPPSDGLPRRVCDMLRGCLEAFYARAHGSDQSLAQHAQNLHACLQIHLQCSRLDPVLGVELGAQGTHALLRRLITHDVALAHDDGDVIMELQDVACEIAALYSNFPMKASPFTTQTLMERLPLTFCMRAVDKNDKGHAQDEAKHDKEELVLIHQVTQRQTAQADVGFGTCWCSISGSRRDLLKTHTVCYSIFVCCAHSHVAIGSGAVTLVTVQPFCACKGIHRLGARSRMRFGGSLGGSLDEATTTTTSIRPRE